jgi:hypothetical protein
MRFSNAVSGKPARLEYQHADQLGMLKNVLNVLSAEVSGDTDNVPGDTALTGKARLRASPPPVVVVEDEREKKKQKYRDGVDFRKVLN